MFVSGIVGGHQVNSDNMYDDSENVKKN